jgi:diguanylate cyclase
MAFRPESPTLPATLPGPAPWQEPPRPQSNDHPARLSLPLGTLTLLFVIGSVAVAAAIGYALAVWVEPGSPWMVSLASAVGVMCTALPLGVALFGLARRSGPAPLALEAEAEGPAASSGATGPATGLALGREFFMDMVGREWARSRRYGTGAALLLVEIDRYARLADALGEEAAEKVLADLIVATAPTLRGADALTRHGAGQMAVFLAHADATGALDVAERIRERAEQMEVAMVPRRVRFTVCVGVAHLRPSHLHLNALIDDVSEALAAARGVGGNCVRAAPVDLGQRPSPGQARDGHRADKK